jgi:hypothetical protein
MGNGEMGNGEMEREKKRKRRGRGRIQSMQCLVCAAWEY